MKKIVLILSVFLSALSVKAQDIEATELAKKIENQPLLVDVRTNEEYKEGSIIGAVNFDIHSDEFRRMFEHFPREKEIILFCQGGDRSRQATGMLREMGFKNIFVLAGGYDHWLKQEEMKKKSR